MVVLSHIGDELGDLLNENAVAFAIPRANVMVVFGVEDTPEGGHKLVVILSGWVAVAILSSIQLASHISISPRTSVALAQDTHCPFFVCLLICFAMVWFTLLCFVCFVLSLFGVGQSTIGWFKLYFLVMCELSCLLNIRGAHVSRMGIFQI